MATARKRTRQPKDVSDPTKMFSRNKIALALEAMDIDAPKFFMTLSKLPTTRGPRELDAKLEKAGAAFEKDRDLESFAKALGYDTSEAGWKQRAHQRLGNYFSKQS